jgi:hypothetical protein
MSKVRTCAARTALDLAIHGLKRAGDGATGHDLQSVLDECQRERLQRLGGADLGILIGR